MLRSTTDRELIVGRRYSVGVSTAEFEDHDLEVVVELDDGGPPLDPNQIGAVVEWSTPGRKALVVRARNGLDERIQAYEVRVAPGGGEHHPGLPLRPTPNTLDPTGTGSHPATHSSTRDTPYRSWLRGRGGTAGASGSGEVSASHARTATLAGWTHRKKYRVRTASK